MNYNVIQSGSRGNAVLIESLLIDIGVPYKALKEHLHGVKYIFITHKHSDHLSQQTYKRIRRDHPRIKIMGNWSVAEVCSPPLDMITTYLPVKLRGMVITPFEVPHDVVTHGLVIEKDDVKAIYVTDSAGTKMWPRDKYDLFFIESNHCEKKLALAKSRKGYDPRDSSRRHTSTQESKAFYYMHRKGPESEWVELHKSERFY